MAELTLFDDDAERELPGTGPAAAYSVAEVNAAIAAALRRGFPQTVWVRGEIAGLKAGRNGHRYLILVDQIEGAQRPEARIDAVCFAARWRTVEWRLRRARIVLHEGGRFCFRCRVDFFEPSGRLQLRIEDVDTEWTLGHMAAGREAVLAALRAEGLLEANGRVPMPAVPLRVGLATSVGSAAYNDFVHELAASGLGFRVCSLDCQTQGPATTPAVVAAIAELQHREVDVIALVRGGGSRTDLAWFDDERIARAIATCAVPVVTGIGHEIDTSVADIVAHAAHKTPTAVAAHLVACVGEFSNRAGDCWTRVVHSAGHHLDHAGLDLASCGKDVAGKSARALALGGRDLDLNRHLLLRAAKGQIDGALTVLDRAAASVRSGGRLALARESARLDVSATRLTVAGLRRTLDRHAERLEAATATVAAYDPARVLERGYSLTLDGSGRAVRTVSALTPGQRVRTLLARGEFTSVVSDISEPVQADVGVTDPAGEEGAQT